jgi:hypothetical protein
LRAIFSNDIGDANIFLSFLEDKTWKLLEASQKMSIHDPIDGRNISCKALHIMCEILSLMVIKSARYAVFTWVIYFYCHLPFINKYLLSIFIVTRHILIFLTDVVREGVVNYFGAEILILQGWHNIRLKVQEQSLGRPNK